MRRARRRNRKDPEFNHGRYQEEVNNVNYLDRKRREVFHQRSKDKNA